MVANMYCYFLLHYMGTEKFIIRKMFEDEADQVFTLVKNGYNEFVKADITEEGTTDFFKTAEDFIYNTPVNHFILVALNENRITGMIDVRDNNHICLFFVNKDFNRIFGDKGRYELSR